MNKARSEAEVGTSGTEDGSSETLIPAYSVEERAVPLDEAMATGSVQVIGEEAVMRLLAEDLLVHRRRVETGRVRVRRETREVVRTVDEELTHERHEIETVAIGSFVDERPSIRETDEEIIIPIVEEVLVVERRLRLKEEIHIRKTRVSERHREDVVLRLQEAHVSRLPPKPSRGND